jgi:LPS-assembly lipoprotein
MPQRRTLSRCAALALTASLAGCGWHLRGEIPGTAQAKTIYLTGIAPNNPFYGDFAQVLGTSGGTLAQRPSQAGAVVNIASARHLRRPITLSAQGRANTFDLTFRVIYEIQTPKGEVLVPQQEMEVKRDYFNDQSSPLGQGEEEALLRQEMEREAARTLLRRVVFSLSKLPPAPPAAKAPPAKT